MRNPTSSAWIALLAVVCVSTGCEPAPPVQAEQAPGAKAAPAISRVEVVRPERRTMRRVSEQPGQIEAFEVSALHAKVSGFVQSWSVDIGARVKKGQVLAVLAVPELDADAGQKQAAVEEAEAQRDLAAAEVAVEQAMLVSAKAKRDEVKAGVKRVDADLARWRAEYERVNQLFKEHAQTGSLLDETRSKLRASESAREELTAQVATAEAAVHQSEALLTKARADVKTAESGIKVARFDAKRALALQGYATIVAPFDGVITHRAINVGDLTEPGTHASPVFTVARADLVRVVVAVPEMAATTADPDDRALVRVQALPGQTFEGKVARTSWTLDSRTRTLRVEIDLPNPDGRLRPGLYANTTVIVDEHADALTIPSSAVVRQGAQPYCVVVEAGKAVRKPITVGIEDGTHAEVLKGLRGDEQVVKTGAGGLAEGQSVAASGVKP